MQDCLSILYQVIDTLHVHIMYLQKSVASFEVLNKNTLLVAPKFALVGFRKMSGYPVEVS